VARKRTRKQQKQQNQRLLWIIGAIAVVGVIAALAFSTLAAPTVKLINPDGYQQRFGDGQSHFLLDVRTPEEYASGHIADSVNINVETLADHLDEVPRDVPVVVYCRSGNRSATAAQILLDAGYKQVYDLGGIQDWVAAGYPIQ